MIRMVDQYTPERRARLQEIQHPRRYEFVLWAVAAGLWVLNVLVWL
jgi:hypothetical protein